MVAPKFDDDVKLGGFDHNHTYVKYIYVIITMKGGDYNGTSYKSNFLSHSKNKTQY